MIQVGVYIPVLQHIRSYSDRPSAFDVCGSRTGMPNFIITRPLRTFLVDIMQYLYLFAIK